MKKDEKTVSKYGEHNCKEIKDAAKKKKKEERKAQMDKINPMTGLTYRQELTLELIKGGVTILAAAPGLILACVQISKMDKQNVQTNTDMQNLINAINNLK